MLELIMNGFFAFIAKFCVIPFPFDLTVFDWIPFETKVELVLLLDRWKAAVDRREHIAKYDWYMDTPIEDEQERKTLFETKLEEAYEEAVKRRELANAAGVFVPPELDVEHCEQYCERRVYEARKRANEPVFFANKHCCYDMELWYGFQLIPGPYPGLEHYFMSAWDNNAGAALICDLNEGVLTPFDYGKNLIIMEENGEHVLCRENRAEMFWKHDVIGPNTYGEWMRVMGIRPVPGLTMANHERMARTDGKVDVTKSNVWHQNEASLRYNEILRGMY